MWQKPQALFLKGDMFSSKFMSLPSRKRLLFVRCAPILAVDLSESAAAMLATVHRFIFDGTNFAPDPFYLLRQIGWQDTGRVRVVKTGVAALVSCASTLCRCKPGGYEQGGRGHRTGYRECYQSSFSQ